MINNKNLGCQNLEGFVSRNEAKENLHKHINITFVGAGQAGGKISAEFVRLGYYANMYNTCKEDLEDVNNVLKNLDGAEYHQIRLLGYDGASKDRDIGLKAIKDNLELLQKELISDKHLTDADFVWIVAALGGGTGCGSISTVAQIVSGIMRKDKKYMGKPTVGIIAATPEMDSKQKQKLNSAKALQEIKKLQEKKLIGSTLIIDNDKLIDDFLSDKNNKYPDWTTYGNTTTAGLLTEIAALTCLPAKEQFDKSELLDILTTPGFLNIGKLKLKSIKDEDYDKIIETSFKKANVFADGYDFQLALHGGMAVLIPGYASEYVKDSIKLKRSMNKFLDTATVDVTHFGVFENNTFGTLKEPITTKTSTDACVIIYTLAVVKELPQKVFEMTKDALDKENERKEKLSSYHNTELNSMLSTLNNNAEGNDAHDEISLESILNGDLLNDDKSEAISNNNDDVDYDPLKNLFSHKS